MYLKFLRRPRCAPRAKVVGVTELAVAEKMANDYAREQGISGQDKAALKALRALPAETLVKGGDAKLEVAALSSGKPISGIAGAMIDGKLVVETPEAGFAAGHWAKIPVIVGANNRDLPVGVANSKDELFAVFGPYAGEARKLYNSTGDASLDELKQQVFADRTMTEPARPSC